jgi:ribosome maturation factor RimP
VTRVKQEYPADRPLPPAGATEREAAVVALVWTLADPVCSEEGVDLIHVEYQREPGGRTLRLIIDKPGGVRLDDCTAVSRQLDDLLDAKLDQEASFRLEISSPGPNRPLGRMGDFERFRTCRARIRTVRALKGRRSFTGKLLGLFEDGVRVATPDGEVSIALDNVRKAQLINHHGENPCS